MELDDSSSSSDETMIVAIAAGAFHLYERMKKKKKRRKINPFLAERKTKSRFVTDFEYLKMHPAKFIETFRMDEFTFDEIYDKIKQHLLPKRYTRPDAISPLQKFVLVLEYFATGTFAKIMGSKYRISKQHMGAIIDSFCDAVAMELQNAVTEMTTEELCKVADAFYEQSQLPNCSHPDKDTTDATLASQNAGILFYNYTGFHSKLLFSVADVNYKFNYLDIGAYGGGGDFHIFATMTLGTNVAGGTVQFPQTADMGKSMMPFYFTDDDNFPLCKEFRNNSDKNNKALCDNEQVQKNKQNPPRPFAINALSIMCEKWRVLKRTPLCNPERAEKIIYACCLLHNYLIKNKASKYTDIDE